MKETFILDGKDRIVIYGASRNGIIFANIFIQNGFEIAYFIDKRASEMQGCVRVGKMHIPVYRMEELSGEDKNSVVIYIAIRNANEQTKCAIRLGEKGYKKLIYLPLYAGRTDILEEIQSLSYVYNELGKGCVVTDISCPTQDCFVEKNVFLECNTVQHENLVMLEIPLDIVFYFSFQWLKDLFENVTGEDIKVAEKHADKPFWQQDFLKNLFLFFYYGNGDIQRYLSEVSVEMNDLTRHSDIDSQLWLDDRKCVIERLGKGIFEEQYFWEYSAIPVQWNEKGFFNILDGSHRVMMACVVGMHKIRVEMSTEDYERWLNKSFLDPCLEYLNDKNIVELPTPVSHPYFQKCRVESENFGKTVLAYIQEYLTDETCVGKKILDVNPMIGYYAQHFTRMGGEVTVLDVMLTEEYRRLLELLNALFYMQERIEVVHALPDEKYDIVLCMKVRDLISDTEEWIEFLRKVNDLTGNMMIWESGVEIEVEKNMIMKQTDFKNYHKLRGVLEDKKIREVGIFTK